MASGSLPSGGGGGSPSGHAGSDRGAASASVSTPASESTVARRLNGLDLQGDDAPSSQPVASKKKKRGARAVGPDKNGRGLRQFSMRVCEKVESKGRTTYNEIQNRPWCYKCGIGIHFGPSTESNVADELVAEFSDPNNIDSQDPDNPNAQQYDEKNIRRRVYDALNVLMAMEIISKDKKEIQWKGLPRKSMDEVEDLKTEIMGMKGRIDKKNAYLQDLQDQYVSLQNLLQRNEQLYGSGDDAPSGGVALPFILVQTRPHATVEVEISEDMQLVHFDFNSTPFELQDDSFVMKAMCLSGKEEIDVVQVPDANGGEVEVECSSTPTNHWHQSQQPAGPRGFRLPPSAPIPGILKGRVKHEH